METSVLHGSLDQSISPYKSHLRNPKKIQHAFISRPSEFCLPPHFNSAGCLLQAPPPFLSQSYPPYSLQQSPQPPLLPLPAAYPLRSATTYPPVNKKSNNCSRSRYSSLTPKKLKFPKQDDKNSPKKPINVPSYSLSGPDPKVLPKDVAKVLPSISSSSGTVYNNANNCINRYNSFSYAKGVEDKVDIFSGSVVFAISPPPSSLPLPTFSLRPKLSCKAEAAAGIDTGATDNLRRLLRLRGI